MNTGEKRSSAQEPFVTCMDKKQLNAENIQALTCEQLVQSVRHELTQKAAIAAGFLEVLLYHGNYGFVNERQEELLHRLEKEIRDIQVLNDMLDIWLSGSKNVNGSTS